MIPMDLWTSVVESRKLEQLLALIRHLPVVMAREKLANEMAAAYRNGYHDALVDAKVGE